MKTIFPQKYKVKDKSALAKPIIKADEVEPLDGETILKTLIDCADRMMMCLEMNDCDEHVAMRISRDSGLICLDINNEVYLLSEGEWINLSTKDKE